MKSELDTVLGDYESVTARDTGAHGIFLGQPILIF
jgi:hypothetical protein